MNFGVTASLTAKRSQTLARGACTPSCYDPYSTPKWVAVLQFMTLMSAAPEKPKRKLFSLARIFLLVAAVSFIGEWNVHSAAVAYELMLISQVGLTIGCLLVIKEEWKNWQPAEFHGCCLVVFIYAVLMFLLVEFSHSVISAMTAAKHP